MPARSALPEACGTSAAAKRLPSAGSNHSSGLPRARNCHPRKVRMTLNNRYYGNGVVKKIHFVSARPPLAGSCGAESKTSLPWLQPTNLVKVHSQTVESEPTDSALVSLGRSIVRSIDKLSIFRPSADEETIGVVPSSSPLDTTHNCTLYFEVSKKIQQFTVYLVLRFRKKAALVLANYCLSNEELARYLTQKLIKQEIGRDLEPLEQKCRHLLVLVHVQCYINDLEVTVE